MATKISYICFFFIFWPYYAHRVPLCDVRIALVLMFYEWLNEHNRVNIFLRYIFNNFNFILQTKYHFNVLHNVLNALWCIHPCYSLPMYATQHANTAAEFNIARVSSSLTPDSFHRLEGLQPNANLLLRYNFKIPSIYLFNLPLQFTT